MATLTENTLSTEFVLEQISKGRLYIFGLFHAGPAWITDESYRQTMEMEHVKYLFSLKAMGKLPVVGSVTDNPDLRGVMIFNSNSKAEIADLLEKDPLVSIGHFTFHLFDMFSIPGDSLPA